MKTCKTAKTAAGMLVFASVMLILGCDNPVSNSEDGDGGGSSTTEPVTDLVASPGDQSAVLTWVDPPEENLASIEVTWNPDGEAPKEVSAGVETYTASALVNGNEYTFSVVAIDTAGNRSEASRVSAIPAASVVEDDSGHGTTDPDLPEPRAAAVITISFDTPDDPTITIAGSSTVNRGTSLNVTVDAGYDSYSWYVDGGEISNTGSAISVDTSSLYIGTHSIAVVVSDGGNTYSAQFTVTVQE